jgi:membrane carboxypeptidase/penicillin-binding protein
MWKKKIAALVLAFVLVSAAVFLYGWIRTPGLLAKMRSSTAMQLTQLNFREDRLAALLLVEDPGFYRYLGEDKASGGGASQITRKLVEALFFDAYRPGPLGINTGLRNLIAAGFDRRVEKTQQFTYYVNLVGFGEKDGRRIAGFEDAARAYFGKQFILLEDDEYLALVAMLADPERYHVIDNPEANRERRSRIRKYVDGDCRPASAEDVELAGCQ